MTLAKTFAFSALVSLFSALSALGAEYIIIQSTTSTQNSGLLSAILPKFEAHSGIKAQTTPSTSCNNLSIDSPLADVRACADQGYARAQYNLGGMYFNGYGVPKDDVEAVRLYRLAADQGYVDAQFNLGGMYFNGYGVPKDNVKTYMWMSLAAAQGNERAQRNIAIMGRSMPIAQIAEAQRMIREWMARHPPE